MAALSHWVQLTALLLPLTLLTGCGGLSRSDGAPARQLDPNRIDDAVPRRDPITGAGNKNPYTVLGKSYRILPTAKGYRARGVASWYGTKFHGESTANGERYDLYAMTAAHCTLPIPTYVQVTNLENGKQCIVRVNDRGPFVEGRLIDLSYAAATKLGYAHKGTALVEIAAIDMDNWPPRNGEQAPRTVVPPVPVAPPASVPATVAQPSAPLSSNVNNKRSSTDANNSAGTVIDAGVGGAPIAGAVAVNGGAANSGVDSGKGVKVDVAKAATVNAINTAEVSAASNVGTGSHYVQIGAFGSNAAAEKLRTRVAGSTTYRVIVQPTPTAPVLYRVRIGPFNNAVDAEQAREQLHSQLIDGVRVSDDAAPR